MLREEGIDEGGKLVGSVEGGVEIGLWSCVPSHCYAAHILGILCGVDAAVFVVPSREGLTWVLVGEGGVEFEIFHFF